MLTTICASFAFSQILLTLYCLLNRKQIGISEKLFCALLTAVAIYLLAPAIAALENVWLTSLASALFTSIPALFWLSSIAIFDDQFHLNKWHILLLAATVIPPFLYRIIYYYSDLDLILLVDLPQMLEFVLISLGLLQILRSWKNDLIEKRRHFRIFIMGFAGTMIFVVIFVQQAFGISSQTTDFIQLPLLALFLLILNTQLLRFKENTLLFTNEASPPRAEPSKQLRTLLNHMENERIYRQSGLSITELAHKISLPEYKLRKLINEELQYRNFNDFLNHFRIADASLQLKSDEDAITNIALSVGYKSLSSFNKAFKAIHEKTPSEYRKS